MGAWLDKMQQGMTSIKQTVAIPVKLSMFLQGILLFQIKAYAIKKYIKWPHKVCELLQPFVANWFIQAVLLIYSVHVSNSKEVKQI